MVTPRRRALVALAGVALVFGGGNASYGQDDVVPTTTAAPPTTIAPTTTAAPATTVAPTATTAPTTATTVVPTTTVPTGPEPEALTGHLQDIAAQVGLSNTGHSWDLAVGRIDSGRTSDLVMADHGDVHVWLNRGQRLELLVVLDKGDPHGCAVADVDGNGLGDLYCTHGAVRGTGSRPNRLYLQGAEGQFVESATTYAITDPFGRGRRVAFGDFDHVPGPDLFVGNQFGRANDHLSTNRVFFGGASAPMVGAPPIAGARAGALCLQVADQDGDGWQDALLCGGREEPLQPSVPTRLFLLRNVPDGHGGRRFAEVASASRIAVAGVRSARLADLNGDRRLDLVLVTDHRVVVRPGLPGGVFGPPAHAQEIAAGNWVAVGDVDGRNGNDLFVVQGCDFSGNVRDLLLLHRSGFDYRTVNAPTLHRGCGDTAVTMEVDGHRGAEVIVGNGRWTSEGPYQVLTYRG